jgi:hypothetical protein
MEGIMIKRDIVAEWVDDQRRRGTIEGLAKGEAWGMAKSLLAILSKRGLTFSPEQHDAILSCNDLERLDHWITRALTVESADNLFSIAFRGGECGNDRA